ncbi:RagB/SusD family nutrient uptake outer membrane protein [Cytophagaceae bacterium DM2B3-1]|uniref:RagB/SusD family nutrient uptake outer membrane protein n=1 Tax=Xanthocytophaga flava TaxID=3048013 RepID=A0ABT7CNS2_9BACT|nr:RagB/SusD family nutrient uptake outer membrane protein [Xanthocytophaga flavus]MDJ1495391.1 RagB/SusD family nutrient uptake outer membrane protein [Xanthocytophaga flavus]
MKKYRFFMILSGAALLSIVGCTDLDDKVLDRISADDLSGIAKQLEPASALQSVYAQLNPLTDQANVYAMQEHPTDEMVGPTRGTDWSDFGTWRRLHQHSWDATHNQVVSAWDILNIGVFRANQAIYFAANNTQIKAEASFLRAFFMFQIIDLYGQVPFREVTDDPISVPKVFTRSEAFDFMINDLEFALNNLSENTPGKATPNAARALLAKAYLNKAVYKQDPNNPAGPFTFDPADMNKAIEYCNAIINSGDYELTDYFDNFHWENSTRSKELIFVIANTEGSPVGTVQNRYFMTLHYYQPLNGGGWNGFTTLADFYDSFESADKRRGASIPGMTDKFGMNAGFMVGQQYVVRDGQTVALKDRGGKPLDFTKDVDILYSNERRGIRVLKYFPEPIENPDASNASKPEAPDFLNAPNPGTDYIFLRYADVLLMKAEAILRGGTGDVTALSLVNELRASRGASTLSSLDEATLLAERGRELYWEGWRRNDMIRFGAFLKPFDQKSTTSPAHVVVFPIPQRALDTNPNLKQNVGY